MVKKLLLYVKIYIYFTYNSLLTAQKLWQVHYQILSIIFLKEFIQFNVNSDTMIKNVKHVELNISIANILNISIQTLKMIY